ncbi:MAG: hypothetical protein HY698_05960 [Deltaproteobacteria bacterium]|nr:hypothetical protein [Deltaproteobacteria bacterium]
MSCTLLSLLPLLVSPGLARHSGGVPTRITFASPGARFDVADGNYDVTWAENSDDKTGELAFFYQPSNVPVGTKLSSSLHAGTPIPGGEKVPVEGDANVLKWDTSSVPAGSYFVYSVTQDPPLDPVASFSPLPVTIRHQGDPPWPAVTVDKPDVGELPSGVAFAIRWRASGASPLHATIRYGAVGTEDPPEEIAADLPMVGHANGTFAGCYAWDLSLVPLDSYYIQVEVKDSAGRSHSAYSRSSVVVDRDSSSADPKNVPTCADEPWDAGSPRSDGGRKGDDDGGCSCEVGRDRKPGGVSAVLLLGLLTSLRRPSGRRERPHTYPPSAP